jgi:hypothetical protein
MSIIPPRLQSLIDHLKEQEEREKAAQLLAGRFSGNTILIEMKSDAAKTLKAARARLDDMHRRLDITLRSSLLSETIH